MILRHLPAPVRHEVERLRKCRCGAAVLVTAVLAAFPAPARAQTITDALSFLLTNRSIPTGDFARDEEAATATRDTIATLLKSELGTLPVTASASGFTYRMDPALGGVPVRSTATFGAFLTDRSLTVGRRHLSLAATYQAASFDRIDGRDLRSGTLRATASRLTSDPVPFDVETVTLRIHTDALTFSGNYGVTDRLDIGGALPIEWLTLSGERIDTYRATPVPQATVAASTSGPGDLLLRTKFHLIQNGRAGLGIGAEARLPTGSSVNLLGAARASVKPRLIWSVENNRFALDSSVAYGLGGISDEFDYSAAVTTVASSRLTIIGELSGRRLDSVGRLIDVTSANPRLAGVETIRLSALTGANNRAVVVAGAKWNVKGTWLVTGNVWRSLGTAGLTARWMSTFGAEYAFGE
jgi:hypothetical protein